ncbi:hypothetical protein [Novilysobacter spongiicola]|uniref:Uncharacterized protein n=1 Tax=Lysobacter spongiicola DSM 21749 TaxID=1122188 RepID=A0A1T4RFJ2_9GAMM|nr:hypothetical protein [Lysobacter spongiicola]SKA14657.1 hypothetical protein SAMN02745674_02151 [Lysobacter spongiicola DSM 21749]
MLLNIDRPLRSATLHADDCNRIPKPVGTQYKPVGELGRDGGWFTVADERQARAVAHAEFERGEFHRCQFC